MSIEILEGLKRKAKFSISKKDVNGAVETELKKYAKDAKAPGFRPGKLPSHMVKQIYGTKAYEDALNNHINKKFIEVIDGYNIKPIGYPEFDLVNKEDAEAEEFMFTAIFEVMPEVKLNDLSLCKIDKPTCKFEDSKIDITINALRKQRATYIETDTPATTENKVTVSFYGTVDGVAFEGGSADNYDFIIGEGYMLPDFEQGIIGLKVGESKDVEVKFPENYNAENLKGKTAIFKITLKKVGKAQLPELNEEFIKTLGVVDGNIDTLRAEVKTNLEHELEQKLHAKTRENILNILLKLNPLDLPDALVHDEIHRMMNDTKENMKNQGYPENKINLTHDMFVHDAKRFVSLRLLVQEFIKENNVTVDSNEVRTVVSKMARLYDDTEGYINWYYQDNNRVANAKAIAIENKVLDLILEKSDTKEVEVNYDEIMKSTL
jgi:trigger factor